MSILDFFFARRPAATASVARERLQIVLAHERAGRDAPEFLPLLQKELIDVVGRYLEVSADMIRVNLGRHGGTSTLEINVEIDSAKVKPLPARPKGPAMARARRRPHLRR
jgi:cell division topological specificity factor